MNTAYMLKHLEPDTPIETIIDIINGLGLSMTVGEKTNQSVLEFIEKHPELIEELPPMTLQFNGENRD